MCLYSIYYYSVLGLEENGFMEIRMSLIDNRFYGAFAVVDIGSNVCIGQYKGKMVGVNDTISNYKHYLSKHVIIDASDFLSCHGRYINDCLISDENVKMKINYKTNVIDIVTTRSIKRNDEILTDYGPDYWEGKAASMHSHDPTKEFSLVVSENKKRKREYVEGSLLL